MKKSLFIILLTLLPLLASAETIKVANIWYSLDKDNLTAEVIGNPSGTSLYSGDITIPDALWLKGITYNVTSVGKGAFFACTGLTSVKFGEYVTAIGDSAFIACTGLTSLAISKSIASIGKCAFAHCRNLATITVDKDNSVYDSRYNCNAVIETRTNTLVVGCKNTYITPSVTVIGQGAFAGCWGLTSVLIHNNVTSIYDDAFANCSNLETVTIGNGLMFIAYHAFADCALRDFYCYTENVPRTVSSAFDDSNIGNATLHVLKGSMDAYKAATPWKSFKYFKEIEGIKLDKSEAIVEKGKTLKLTVRFPTSYTFQDQTVTWKSSNTKVATVTNTGTVKGVKAGTATITCTSEATGLKATCKVTVGYVKLDQTEAILQKGKTMTLTATVYPSKLEDKTVTWKSSNTKIATVTSKGKVKGVKAGTATITCTSKATGLSTTCTVTIGYVKLDQTEAIIQKGKTMTLTATVYPSKLEDKSVTWSSSNTKIATVTSKGKVKGVKAGTATITCTSNVTGLSTTCEVTVGYVKLDQTEVSVKKGKTVTLTASVYPSKLEDKSVTWESSDTKIATVTSTGKVKGVKAGTATITCTSNATGLSTTCAVTVTTTSGSRSMDGDDDETTGIEENAVAVEPFDVYDLSGHKVLNQVTSLDGLPNGIYILNGKKVVKKD